MRHSEIKIQGLKEDVKTMWKLVVFQLEEAKKALLSNDSLLAEDIIRVEKEVNDFELRVERDCENYIALKAPVAIDLRLALSLIQVSNALERIGDFSEGIALHVRDEDCEDLQGGLFEELELERMLDILLEMLLDGFVLLDSENTSISNKIITRDDQVDEIYHNAFGILAQYIQAHPGDAYCALKLGLRSEERRVGKEFS